MRNHSSPVENHGGNRSSSTTKIVLVAIAMLLAGPGLALGVASGSTFNNVQVFVTTDSQLPYSYTYTVYNMTGSLLATYQGSFSAAAFELPSGDYLFTVSALYQPYGGCYGCVYTTSDSAASGQSVAYTPVKYLQPSSEYGYQVAHVDSSKSLTIATRNVTQFQTTAVTVKVSYVNGTAAAGASVSTSVVGQWYYWWGQDSNVVMWAQTGPDGYAKLVLPVAPAVITAWNWVPVDLPTSQTTVTRVVGGEVVNVTVYWAPSYVGLSASTLLMPPASSANLVLHYQPPSYWAMPEGVKYAPGSAGATVADQQTGVPFEVTRMTTAQSGGAQYYVPGQIPAVGGVTGAVEPPGTQASALGPLTTTAALGVALVFASFVIAVVVLRTRQRPPEAHA